MENFKNYIKELFVTYDNICITNIKNKIIINELISEIFKNKKIIFLVSSESIKKNIECKLKDNNISVYIIEDFIYRNMEKIKEYNIDLLVINEAKDFNDFCFNIRLKEIIENNKNLKILNMSTFNNIDDFNIESEINISCNNVELILNKIDDLKWAKGYLYLFEYYQINKSSIVNDKFKTNNGYNLGQWCAKQRSKWDNLNHFQQELLLNIGFNNKINVKIKSNRRYQND